MKGVGIMKRSGDVIKTMTGLDVEVVNELISYFERADSKPNCLTKALRLLEVAVVGVGDDGRKFYGQKSTMYRALERLDRILRVNKYDGGRIRSAVAKILNKVIIKVGSSDTRKRASAGTFVCLLNKLKPTSDGKDDAEIINKANVMNSFFDNLGVITYDGFKNQALA